MQDSSPALHFSSCSRNPLGILGVHPSIEPQFHGPKISRSYTWDLRAPKFDSAAAAVAETNETLHGRESGELSNSICQVAKLPPWFPRFAHRVPITSGYTARTTLSPSPLPPFSRVLAREDNDPTTTAADPSVIGLAGCKSLLYWNKLPRQI